MNQPQSDVYRSWQLDTSTIRVTDLETVFYGPPEPDVAKPNILLVHGIGGDRHGITPLGWALSGHFNVYMVELPGHGATDIPADRSSAYWMSWAAALPKAFADQGISFSTVVGHSSGCVAVASMELPPEVRRVMINPTPVPTRTYKAYVRVMRRVISLVGGWYGWYPVAFWRGLVLMRRRSDRRAIETVSWVSRNTFYSKDQFYYQIDVALDWPSESLFDNLRGDDRAKLLVIAAADDTIPSDDYFELRRMLPDAELRLLPGGHLLPIESAAEVAQEILRQR